MYTSAMLSMVMLLVVSGLGGIHDADASTAMRWQFAYDDAGRMVKAVDPAGRRTTRRYELSDNKRVQSIVQELPDASRVTYDFDPSGRPISMTDAGVTVRYAHDGFGRLITVQRDGIPVISYTYDTLNRLRSITVGEGWTILYTYDFLGRLAEIDTPVGKTGYEYRNGQGMIVRTLPNGIRTIWTYRPDGNLESIAHVSHANKLLQQISYAYRPDGLISEIKERSPDGEKRSTYTYDTRQRLIAVADSQDGTTQFDYDKLGNRTEVHSPSGQIILSTYDWAGRLLRHADQETAHDWEGDLPIAAITDGKA
jgi:YD repeat-containing protein